MKLWNVIATALQRATRVGGTSRLKTLLTTLAESIEAAETSQARDELRVEWACCAARYGKTEDAKRVCDEIRSTHASGEIPRLSIWILILESLISYYSDRGLQSLDRAIRANILARNLGFRDLTGISSGWKAHLEFNFNRYASMGDSISDSFQMFSSMTSGWKARSCVVLADGLQFTGSWQIASDWYQSARKYALEVHDHAGLTTIEFNRLAIGLSRQRAETLIGAEAGKPQRAWGAELDSVSGMHDLMRNKSLVQLLRVCQVRVHQTEGRYLKAAEVLEDLRQQFSPQATGFSARSLNIELMWCRHRAGVASGEPFDVLESDLQALRDLDPDDRFACCLMLKELGDAGLASCVEANLEEEYLLAVANYETSMEALSRALMQVHELTLSREKK